MSPRMGTARATGWHPSTDSATQEAGGGEPEALLGWRVNSGDSGQLVRRTQNKIGRSGLQLSSGALRSKQEALGSFPDEGEDDGGTPQRKPGRRGTRSRPFLCPSLPPLMPGRLAHRRSPAVAQTWSEAGWTRNTLAWVTSPPGALS